MRACVATCLVLGRDVGQVGSLLDGMKRRFPVAEDDIRISGCLIEIDPSTGLSLSIKEWNLQNIVNQFLFRVSSFNN